MNRSLQLPERPRILVTRADRIGDLVLSTPVFQALRDQYPNAWIGALTFFENREILEGHPAIDELILYDKKGSEHGWIGNFIFARRIAKQKFDLVIHLHATNRMHLATWMAGIPIRIGYDRKAGWALTRAVQDMKRLGEKHEAEYNFDLLAPLGIEVPHSFKTYFPVSDRARRSFDELAAQLRLPRDKPWIALHPGSSCASKRWPAVKFGELAARLAAQYNAAVMIVGVRSDRLFAEKIREHTLEQVWDLTGKLTLAMLAAALQQSALLVSNDSGPVHIADAVGTPVLSLFGRKQAGLSPDRWKPLGSRSTYLWKDVGCDVCLAHACEINFLCLDAISVDEVMARVDSYAASFRPEVVV